VKNSDQQYKKSVSNIVEFLFPEVKCTVRNNKASRLIMITKENFLAKKFKLHDLHFIKRHFDTR